MITITWSEISTLTAPTGGDLVSALPGALELDIVDQESFDISATVTEHAVEDQAAISDHKIPNLDRVRFSVMVSDSPVSVSQGLLGTAFVGLKSGAVVLQGPDLQKSEIALDTLHRLAKEDIEVDIIGLQREIQGWQITSVMADKRPETSGALVASITAQERAVAKLTEVDAPSPRVERARPSVDTGQQVTQAAGSSVVSDNPVFRDTGTQSLREDWYETSGPNAGAPIL